MWIVERHGFSGWEVPELPPATVNTVLWHQEAFRRRKRRFAQAEDGFEHTMNVVLDAVADLGTGWAADLFFAAERDYWTRRNRAARFQKTRQDSLGLGWQNHDHHTYRSSRGHFAGLIRVLQQLGLACRERFYAGREAGWGAQVLEQEEGGVVVFADVDLGPEEVVEDFAHQPLRPRRSSARWACGACCTARRCYRPVCTTWSAASISTPPGGSCSERACRSSNRLPICPI